MKILYAIQGTGNGHLSRAHDIVPLLKNKAHVDVLVSGIQADLKAPFDVKYRLNGLSFIFGKKGGVDLWQTIKKADFTKLAKEIRTLPVYNYDLIINDFEPVSAWAAKRWDVPCISLSHQSAVLHKAAPKPETTDLLGKAILNYYAPTEKQYGFHFDNFGENIFTPVIRQQIANAKATDLGHYTVYLPAYSDEKLISILQNFPQVTWHVFSKHTQTDYTANHIQIKRISNAEFIDSMVSATGILCGAGFETPAETLYLGKKLMVIPMRNQYEQQCNAAALEAMGVPCINYLNHNAISKISAWLNEPNALKIAYKNETEEILDRIISEWKVRIYENRTALITNFDQAMAY